MKQSAMATSSIRRLPVALLLGVVWALGVTARAQEAAPEGGGTEAAKPAADAAKPEGAAEAAKPAGAAKPEGEGAASEAPSDEEAAGVTVMEPVSRDSYVNIAALIWVTFVALIWICLMEWVTADVRRIKAGQSYWNTGLLLLGIFGVGLSLYSNWMISFFAFPALLGVGIAYVVKRNQLAPPEERVLTRRHLAILTAHWLAKMGVRVSYETLSGEARNDEPEIELKRKDGQSLDALSTRRGGGSTETSEAVLAIKEVVESAILTRVTDIHLEPKQSELQVRFRIDGILHSVPSYPRDLAPQIVSALKVLSDMDIAERRKPQDGGFMGEMGSKTYDFRVATTPTVHGESMVIRILDRDQGLLRLERLGMDPKRMEQIRRIINSPHGMMLVSGPTGSGKSTTLYAALQEIDAYQKNVMTVENPIEYRLDNITQTQINPKAGVTFSGQLRSLLRQDPDVMMIGEIRDAETARTALQAAMTGHFVLSTVHANDALSTLYRLMDLGVEPYLIASSLTAVLAQRLVRVLCENCKQPYVPKPEFVKKVGLDPRRVQEFFRAEGCEVCQGTGYYGRVGLFELVEITDAIRDLLRGRPNLQVLKASARKAGMMTLQEDGLRKVVQGVTAVKELIRVTK